MQTEKPESTNVLSFADAKRKVAKISGNSTRDNSC